MFTDTILKFLKLDGLINHLTSYIEARLELVKYELKEDLARAMAKLAIVAVIAMFVTMFILFLSVSVAYILSEYVGLYGGFGIVAGVYLLLTLILIFFREPISKKIETEIKKTINHKHHENTGD